MGKPPFYQSKDFHLFLPGVQWSDASKHAARRFTSLKMNFVQGDAKPTEVEFEVIKKVLQ
jgi:hypothetical protein